MIHEPMSRRLVCVLAVIGIALTVGGLATRAGNLTGAVFLFLGALGTYGLLDRVVAHLTSPRRGVVGGGRGRAQPE
ncbi:hypothetical protein [Kribbella sp. NPDC048915]|uniref:hypothetical protein n=1 Tax=Kribbella sp. NPDC048915 TaxID=3155148 RepID=UPI0033E30EA9